MPKSLISLESNALMAVAGEKSGDILGARILSGFTQLCGIGGEAMAAIGQKQWFTCHDLAVRGYVEALPALWRIYHIRQTLLRYLRTQNPRLYLGIDAADFNLHIEQYAYKVCKVVHIISPSIWAWRGERIKKIQKAVDYMLCLFPFEPDIYHRAGVKASFIGHPLAEQIPLEPSRHDKHAIAILPGSRRIEIRALLPTFLEVVARLYADGERQFILPVAHPALKILIENMIAKAQHQDTLKGAHIQCVDTMAQALDIAKVALVASGTASLEVALYKVPMVIAYQVPWLTAQIMKRQAYIDCVGLPNILLKQKIVPELLQDHMCAEQIYAALSAILYKDRQTEHFYALHHSLYRADGIALARMIIEDYRRLAFRA